MASQIVLMPSYLIDRILNHPETPRLIAFGSRDLHTRPCLVPGVGRVLRIEIDRPTHCPDVSNRLSDDVLAILLTSAQSTTVAPEPLPDEFIQRLLSDVQAALMELRHLAGHEKMEIAVAIQAARDASGVSTQPPVRSPSSPAERMLLQDAAALQGRLKPALDRIDRKLAAYGGIVRKNGLALAVARLGFQAELGASLRLDDVEGGFLPRLVAPHRYGAFEQLWRATLNRLTAFQSTLDAIHRSACDGSNWLDDLLPIQATLLDQLVEPWRSGRYRTGPMVIQSPFNGDRHDLAVPAEAVPAAMDAFANSYDSRLWHGLHPLLRAGLAHCELVRIHPFSDGNGRLARLTLQGMLIENRIPALPLEAVFACNRHTYIERTDAAVCKGNLLGFMQWLIKAVDKSIELGRYFMREIAPVRDKLYVSFSGVDLRFATVAAEQSVSMLVGPDSQFLQRAMNADAIPQCLQEAGFDAIFCGDFEVAGKRMALAYSCPLAQNLLVAPPARM